MELDSLLKLAKLQGCPSLKAPWPCKPRHYKSGIEGKISDIYPDNLNIRINMYNSFFPPFKQKSGVS